MYRVVLFIRHIEPLANQKSTWNHNLTWTGSICTVWARTKRFLQCLFTLLNRMYSKRRFSIIVERSFTTYDVLGTRSDNKRNFQRERDRNVVQYVRSCSPTKKKLQVRR